MPTPKDVFGGKSAMLKGPLARLKYPDGTALVVKSFDEQAGEYRGAEIYADGSMEPIVLSADEFAALQRDLADPTREHVAAEAIAQADAEIAADRERPAVGTTAESPASAEREVVDPEVIEELGEEAVVAADLPDPLTPENIAMLEQLAANKQPVGRLNDENREKLEAMKAAWDARAAGTAPVSRKYDGTAKGFSERLKARANNPEAPEQPQAAPEAEDPAKADENAQPTPPPTSPTPESVPDDEAAKIAATLEQIRQDLDVDAEIGQRLSAAIAEYARCKADVDTKPGRIGRKKREHALETSKTAMLAAQTHFAQMLVEAKEKAKLYDTLTDEERQQQRSDDFFDECRLLGRNARRATLTEREQRIKDRGVFGKFMARAGGFLNGGKSTWGKRLRTGGTGAVAGGMKAGLGMALSGVGWPIVAVGVGALGLGMRSGVGYASRMNMLDQSLAAEKATLERTYAAPVILNAEAQKEAASNSESTRAKIATAMMGKELDMAHETSQNDLDKATAKARQNMKRFMTGWAIGAGVTVGAHALHDFVASHNAVPAPESPPAPNTSGTPPQAVLDSIANQNGSHGFEFAPGADTISPGEGFYSQFADMGFSPEQAKDLYSNKPLMEELIKQGVAMRSSDPTSPYWIRMPASGHLSSQAMSTIKAAAEAKGFIR